MVLGFMLIRRPMPSSFRSIVYPQCYYNLP